MTGAQFKTLFNSVYNEMQFGILSNTKLNEQIKDAYTEYFTPMFKEFGLNSNINAALEPLITTVTVPTPSSNSVVKSTSLTNYQVLIDVITTFVENGNTYTKTASPLPPNSMNNSMSSGSAIYPRYFITSTSVELYPKSISCTSVIVQYFRKPFTIDVTDAVTDIPYNEAVFMSILDNLLSIYGLSLGDNRYSAFEREEDKNSQILTK
jgi:hypothetical protein